MAAIPEILPPERKEAAPQPKREPIIIEGKIEGNGEPAQTLKGITPITRQDRLLPAQVSPSSNGQEANQEAGLVHVPRKPATYIGAGLALAAAKTQSNAMVVDRALNGEYVGPKQETGLAPVSSRKSAALVLNEKEDKEPVRPDKPVEPKGVNIKEPLNGKGRQVGGNQAGLPTLVDHQHHIAVHEYDTDRGQKVMGAAGHARDHGKNILQQLSTLTFVAGRNNHPKEMGAFHRQGMEAHEKAGLFLNAMEQYDQKLDGYHQDMAAYLLRHPDGKKQQALLQGKENDLKEREVFALKKEEYLKGRDAFVNGADKYFQGLNLTQRLDYYQGFNAEPKPLAAQHPIPSPVIQFTRAAEVKGAGRETKQPGWYESIAA